MASSSATVRLPVYPVEALGACRQAMSGEVWEIEYQGRDRLVAREWPWRINCQTRPARIEIRVVSAADGATELRLEASAPGFGPIATRHLINHLRGLEEKIRRDPAPRTAV
jgi:hypothetical protein